MGPLFPLLLCSFAIALLFLLWRYGKRTNHRAPFRTAFVILCIFVVVPVAVNTGLGFIPSYAFESSLGFSPSPEITEIKGYTFGIFDGRESYLKFRCPAAKATQLISSEFQEITAHDFRLIATSSPAWWNPYESPTAKFYRADDFKNTDGSSSIALLSYHPASGIIHFHRSEILLD